MTNFSIALGSGALATIATQPLDVFRCHLQIDHKLGVENFKTHIRERGIFRQLLHLLEPKILLLFH